MRKVFLFLIALLTLIACKESRKTQTIENIDNTNFDNTNFDVIEIDSCEYIIGSFGYKGYMTHKGNCKYCEQRRVRLICTTK